MPKPSSNYWTQKIHALLHDGPGKALDIRGHEADAKALLEAFSLSTAERFRKESDFAASAADRLPWPKAKYCKSSYDPVGNPFRHPLSGDKLSSHPTLRTAAQATQESHQTLPRLEGDDDRLAFIALWRFWQNWASDKNPEFALLPAETRLPDHTIWTHTAISSALQGCQGGSVQDWIDGKALPDRPVVLLFSIGPVQEFIAAARTTRDLWSGSYLLSYLISKALARVALDFGPDHVVFPNIKGQPLVDLALRDDVWGRATVGDGPLWDAFRYDTATGSQRLLTPSLPNRFLALVPMDMAEHQWKSAQDYADTLAADIQDSLEEVAKGVADVFSGHSGFDQEKFDSQVAQMLHIHWQVVPFPESFDDLAEHCSVLPGDESFQPTAGIDTVQSLVAKMPSEHRDKRYFKNGNVGTDSEPGKLNQASAGWSGLYALSGWLQGGAKSLRSFAARNDGRWETGKGRNKDSLTGREEACLVAPPSENECEDLRKATVPAAAQHSLKPNEALSASTLIKRFWHITHLSEEEGFRAKDFAMPNTHAIADHRPFDNNSEDDTTANDEASKYYAVIALDGDQIGRWLSGSHDSTPILRDLLSDEGRTYFDENNCGDVIDRKRPLTPSFHLLFSEMLGNFSLQCAARIVESFDGRLIYAGGDDVLAMLPADTAVSCAQALRSAFRGDEALVGQALGSVGDSTDKSRRSDRETPLFQSTVPGCIRLTTDAAYRPNDLDPLVSDPHSFPALVPGPNADVSAGIAIGHIKSPLQDLVRAAQLAEKRAKRDTNDGGLGRAACAISLMKRSGEIIEWGFKWADPYVDSAPVLPLLTALLEAIKEETLSGRFSYKLIQVLAPYATKTAEVDGFSAVLHDLILREFDHALRQHSAEKGQLDGDALTKSFATYLAHLQHEKGRNLGNDPAALIEDVIGLLSTVAWIHRHKA